MNIFTPKTTGINAFIDRAKYIMAWRFSLVFSLLFSTLSVVFLFSNLQSALLNGTAGLISIIAFLYLVKTKRYKHVFGTFIIAGVTIVNLSINTDMTVPHYENFLWLIGIVVLSFVGLGKTEGKVSVVLVILSIANFIYLSLNSNVQTRHVLNFREQLALAAEMIAAVLLISYLVIEYLKYHEYFREELHLSNVVLEKKHDENIVLLKEVHHRVKNNLQIIISLLRLQRGDKEFVPVEDYNESINRIVAMSLIHEKLYRQDSLSKVNLKEYVYDLVRLVKSGFSLNEEVEINVTSEVENIDLKNMVPMGLLLNELFTNSYKHAFEESDEKRIAVVFVKLDDQTILMSYGDSGIWKESDKESFGLELIEILASQMEGSFSREGSKYNFKINSIFN